MTIERKYPTYRQLLEALKEMSEENLDLSVTYYDESGDQYYPAILSYASAEDSEDVLGQENCFHPIIKIGQEIKEDDLIKYDIVDEYGEILKQDITYPDIIKYCKEEELTIESFDQVPTVSGDFYVYVKYQKPF